MLRNLERDRKFTIALFGVEESASGSSKLVRIQNDLEWVTSVICSLDESFPSSSIRDKFRLGKFQRNHDRPRPIIVKLNRTSEVVSILSKKKSRQFSIKESTLFKVAVQTIVLLMVSALMCLVSL